MTTGTIFEDSVDGAARPGRLARYFAIDGRRRYMLFVMPAIAVMGAVIVFPWVFTLFMSVHDWRIGQAQHSFVWLDNYAKLLHDERFIGAVVRTLYYTVLAVVLPLVFGVLAALVFHRSFPLRGF